ncbi:MAG: hypothetical protein GHCLOJNM_03109 [bacterium]|nr:hypothetical protein [bacterium]
MDPEMTNLLASIATGALGEKDRQALREKIASDPEAGEVLKTLENQGEPVGGEETSLPFPLSSRFRLGLCQGVYRVFSLDDLELERGLAAAVETVKRVTQARASICIPRQITLDCAFHGTSSQIQLTAGENGDRLRLRVRADWRGTSAGYFEIWDGGNLRSVHAADGEIVETGVRIPQNGVWAIRHSQDPTGVGFRTAVIEFAPQDWISAGVFRAMEGSFRHAVDCFARAMGARPKLERLASKATAFIEALSGLTKVEGMVLMPAAVTRSRAQLLESGALALQPVWRGIRDCCPRGEELPELAALSGESHPALLDLPPEWRALAEATLATIRTGTLPDEAEREADRLAPPSCEGWIALAGYHHLRLGAYREATRVFGSITPSKEDPFGLSAGSLLAEHLRSCSEGAGGEDALRDSNTEVWRAAIAPLISESASEEV